MDLKASPEVQQAKLVVGDKVKATFHARKANHGRRKQRKLVQEEEKSSGCRTFSKQGLSGLKGTPLRNAVRHLKNTFSPVLVIDDNSEPCEEAGSTAKQEQARKVRRCRKRSIRRLIDADEAGARGDPTWPTTLGSTAGKQAAN